MMQRIPLAALALLLSACSGEEAFVNVQPPSEELEIVDAGLDPVAPSPLETPTAWALARNADTVRLISTTVPEDRMDDADLSFFWERADTTELEVVEGDDRVRRWEAILDRRENGRGLLYWFEAVDDTGTVALPAARRDGPARVEAAAIELGFDRPDWPPLRTERPCHADRTRVFDGAEDEATLAPGAPFDVITEPVFVPWQNTQFAINPDNITRGYGVEIGGEAWFFPISILLHHEVANVPIGGKQAVVTYCPLTDTGLTFDSGFDPNAPPKFHDFAPSGLYNSNVMVSVLDMPFDRRTLYSQMLAYGVRGPGNETCAESMPSIQVEFGVWRSMHPETKVLERDVLLADRYDYRRRPNPYRDYWNNDEELRSEVARTDDRLPRKSRVMGVLDIDDPLAVPMGTEDFVVNDRVGAVPVVVLRARGTAIVLERVHPVTGETFELRPTSGAWRGMPLYEDTTDEPGLWSFDGIALTGPAAGERLAWVPSMSAFWFSWYAIYPETRLVTPTE